MTYANYQDIAKAIRHLDNFTGNSSRGVFDMETGEYRVYSYRTLIAIANPRTGGVAMNARKYSQTTSRLQNIIRKAWADLTISELN